MNEQALHDEIKRLLSINKGIELVLDVDPVGLSVRIIKADMLLSESPGVLGALKRKRSERITNLEAKLAKAKEALEKIAHDSAPGQEQAEDRAREALKELGDE